MLSAYTAAFFVEKTMAEKSKTPTKSAGKSGDKSMSAEKSLASGKSFVAARHIKSNGTKGSPGDKVTAESLKASKDEFSRLLESGAVVQA